MVCRSAVMGVAEAAAGNATLQVTLNGQQFGPTFLPFTYYTTPRVSSVVPAAGPIEGGTMVQVRGFSLRGVHNRSRTCDV